MPSERGVLRASYGRESRVNLDVGDLCLAEQVLVLYHPQSEGSRDRILGVMLLCSLINKFMRHHPYKCIYDKGRALNVYLDELHAKMMIFLVFKIRMEWVDPDDDKLMLNHTIHFGRV